MLNGIKGSPAPDPAEAEKQISKLILDWVNMNSLFDDGWTALHLSISSSEALFVYLAETLGADLTAKNKNGVTLLHKAAKDDSQFVIAYLLEKGCLALSAKDKDGNCPLHYACVFQSHNAIRWLIGYGHPLNEKNVFGQTAMHQLISNFKRVESL